MSAITHPPPTAKPEDDPVTAALRERATHDDLTRQARALLQPYSRPRPEVEDVVQKVIVRALSIKSNYDPNQGTVGAWLNGILALVVQEEIRKTRRLPAQLLDESNLWERYAPLNPGPDFDAADLRFKFERNLAKLGLKEQAIVRMRTFDERDYGDIAKQLQITEVYARKLHSRAVAELTRLAADEKEVRS